MPATRALPTSIHVELRNELLQVAHRLHAELPRYDGVGVTLTFVDGPVFAGSNSFTNAVDETQFRLSEGPCLDAVQTRTRTSSTSIGVSEQRWPRFTEPAAGLGLRRALSCPLLGVGYTVGSLNLYGRRPSDDKTTQDHADDTDHAPSLDEQVERLTVTLAGTWLTAVARLNAQALRAAHAARQH